MRKRLIVISSHPFSDGRIYKHLQTVQPFFDKVIYIRFETRKKKQHFEYPLKKIEYYEIQTHSLCFPFSVLEKRIALFLRLSCKLKYIIRELQKNMPNFETLIHCHDPLSLPKAVFLKQKLHGHLIYDRHEYFETWRTFGLFPEESMIERHFSDYVDAVVGVTKEIAKYANKICRNTISTAVIPNYPSAKMIAFDKVHQKIWSFDPSGKINVVYIGSLSRDNDLLFNVIDTLLENNKQIYVTLGGRNMSSKFSSELVKYQKKFKDRFSFIGEVDYKRVLQVQEEAHLGLYFADEKKTLPSSPNKIFEYLNCGTVPFCRVKLSKSDLDVAQTGYLFSPENEKSLIIQKAQEIAKNPHFLKQKMLDCVRVGSRKRWENVSEKYLVLYKELLKITI